MAVSSTLTREATRLLAPRALTALVETLRSFASRSRERGLDYAGARRVLSVTYGRNQIVGRVLGTLIYRTELTPAGDAWIPACTCPVASYCKHAYALGCVVLGSAVSELGFTNPYLRELLPLEWDVGSEPPATPGADLAPRRPVQSPSRGDKALLERIRTNQQVWEREYALGRLLANAPVRGLSVYLSPFPGILDEPDPDLRCWRLADAIAARAGGWLPAILEPFRDRADLTERARERCRAALAQELTAWARSGASTAQRRLRMVLSLAPASVGQCDVVCELRLTSARLHDAVRSVAQLAQLYTEVRQRPGLLPPSELRLLGWFQEHIGNSSYRAGRPPFTVPTSALRALLDWSTETSLVTWGEDVPEHLAVPGGIVAAAPVRIDTAGERLLPVCVSAGGTTRIALCFVDAGGRETPLDEAVYLPGAGHWDSSAPSFVLYDGILRPVIEEPPARLVAQFREIGSLPLESDEREKVINLLARRFSHLTETVAVHTRVYPVAGVVAMNLREDDWLQIRLFAVAGEEEWNPGMPVGEQATVFEYRSQDAWVRVSEAGPEPPAGREYEDLPSVGGDADVNAATPAETLNASPAEEDVWREVPDPAVADLLVAWMETTGAAPVSRGMRKIPPWDDREVGFWLEANRKRIHDFGVAWDERPAGVRYFGNERLRRLLAAPQRLVPRVRIQASGIDWFSVTAEWEAEGATLSDEDLASLRAADTRFVKLSSGWVQQEIVEAHDEAARLLADLGVEAGGGEQKVGLWQLAGADPKSLEQLEGMGCDDEAVAAVRDLRARVQEFNGLPEVDVPPGVRATLRPYQKQGLDFLCYTASLSLGAILADDMGLGKTIQALAWVEVLRGDEEDAAPVLVVCPASVVHNWKREAERFTPDLRVLLMTSGRERQALRAQVPEHDLVVTNYALLRRDIEWWREANLRAVILDEAQNIKNPDAAVTRAAGSLRARHRIVLTGTPLENRALDLWSIANFVNPGYLGPRRRFANRYDRLDAPPHLRKLLAAQMRPILLRRTKQEVAPELPERIEERRDCEMTKGQRRLYLSELRRNRAVVDELDESAQAMARQRMNILAALTRLRQICCHPALAGGRAGLGSGKFDALLELLDSLLAEGHKILVFSQFVQCLKLIAGELSARGIRFHTLTGKTRRRGEVVAAFQEDKDPCVFLVSLKAGGTGLNLTAARHVVLFDPWWNPAVEAQAIDRAHRIGQDRTVIAFRLLTRGTIEERIWELQQRKATLTRDVLGEGGFARSLTKDDLRYLFLED